MTVSTKTKSKDKTKQHKSKDKAPRKRKRHASPPASEAPKKARIEVSRITPNSNSPYHLISTSLYLSLAPKYSYHPEKTFSQLLARGASVSSEQTAHLRSLSPITGVQRHHLDPLLMTYYEPVDGVVIAYDNIRFETTSARIISEAPYAQVWTTVDLLVWRPTKGMVLQGWVNLQSASHIGLLVDNTWNVSIPFARIPEGWEYKEGSAVPQDEMEVDAAEAGVGEGSWIDEKGEKVEELLKFAVESVKAGGSIFIMEGSLLDRAKIESAVMPI